MRRQLTITLEVPKGQDLIPNITYLEYLSNTLQMSADESMKMVNTIYILKALQEQITPQESEEMQFGGSPGQKYACWVCKTGDFEVVETYTGGKIRERCNSCGHTKVSG